MRGAGAAMTGFVHRDLAAGRWWTLTLADPRHCRSVARLREIARAREVLVDFLVGPNEYRSTGPGWRRYFDAYAALASRTR